MGGDDLGSDDEYLTAPLQSALDDNNDDDDNSVEDNDDLDRRNKALVSPSNQDSINNKRKREDQGTFEKQQQQPAPSSQSKKSKKDRKGEPIEEARHEDFGHIDTVQGGIIVKLCRSSVPTKSHGTAVQLVQRRCL